MTDNLIFINDEWLWPVVIGSTLLLFVLVWKEWNRSSKKRRLVKKFIAFLGVLSLAMIALKPAIRQFLDKGIAVLVTDGYEPKRLDSLTEAHKGLKILRYKKSEPLQTRLDSVSSLFVLGHGPAYFDLWQFEEIQTTYVEGVSLSGITQLKYNRESAVGSDLRIKGRYKRPRKGDYIVLQEPGGLGVDSLITEDAPLQEFDLSTGLKVEGKFVYRLIEKDSTGRVYNSENLPITVREPKSLKILFINSFPTFETKYLKNYLADRGHEVVVRSRLTKGTYKFEYLNTERTPLYRLSQENLKKFDLLVIDVTSYKNLSQKSFLEVVNTIRKNGLGVFIQPDKNFFELPRSRRFFDFDRVRDTDIEIKEWPKVRLNNYPFRFKKTFAVQPIHVENDRINSAYKELGLGRMGTTVFENTYRLLLDGNVAVYQKLWTDLLESVGRRNISKAEWQPERPIAIRHQPYDFVLRTMHPSPEVINTNGSIIPLLQDPDFPNVWRGTTYPLKSGWNQLRIKEDSTSVHNFYVNDSTEWKSLLAEKTIAHNKKYFAKAISAPNKTLVLKPIDPIWFFIGFLLCFGWLWLEPRLFENQ